MLTWSQGVVHNILVYVDKVNSNMKMHLDFNGAMQCNAWDESRLAWMIVLEAFRGTYNIAEATTNVRCGIPPKLHSREISNILRRLIVYSCSFWSSKHISILTVLLAIISSSNGYVKVLYSEHKAFFIKQGRSKICIIRIT